MQKPLLSREFSIHAHNIIRMCTTEERKKKERNMDSIFTALWLSLPFLDSVLNNLLILFSFFPHIGKTDLAFTALNLFIPLDLCATDENNRQKNNNNKLYDSKKPKVSRREVPLSGWVCMNLNNTFFSLWNDMSLYSWS